LCGRMERGVHGDLPFTVDTWKPPRSGADKFKVAFLTHAHKDHTNGLDAWQGTVFCTLRTWELLKVRGCVTNHRNLVFEELEVGVERTLSLPSGDTLSVMPLDANHCEGAVQLLLQGAFGTILHTGDARFDKEFLDKLFQVGCPKPAALANATARWALETRA